MEKTNPLRTFKMVDSVTCHEVEMVQKQQISKLPLLTRFYKKFSGSIESTALPLQSTLAKRLTATLLVKGGCYDRCWNLVLWSGLSVHLGL